VFGQLRFSRERERERERQRERERERERERARASRGYETGTKPRVGLANRCIDYRNKLFGQEKKKN
jgi:hypothetical protein